ncbi:hypothetical protein FGB62_249g05 [Gracilaria domingensis]|nr:hypothetical protein FGB62_249g05 [Gracilaria domingensis]
MDAHSTNTQLLLNYNLRTDNNSPNLTSFVKDDDQGNDHNGIPGSQRLSLCFCRNSAHEELLSLTEITLHPIDSGAWGDLYVKTATVGNRGYRGWPRNVNDLGTGAVMAPEFPRARTYCWFQRSEYDLPQSLRDAFCTNSGVDNAAAQLKDAIEKDQCDI